MTAQINISEEDIQKLHTSGQVQVYSPDFMHFSAET